MLSAISALTTHLNEGLGTWDLISRVHVPAYYAQKILEAGPFDKAKFVVFPNAVADPGTRTRPPSKSNRILFVGRLSEEKGLDCVLQAWKRQGPTELKLTVVGDGPARSNLVKLATSDVEFCGQLSSSEVTDLMLDSRALVFPSRWFEVCPMVIVEALSTGLPVIGHDIGAVTELLEYAAPHSLIRLEDDCGWDGALSLLRDDGVVDALGRKSRDAYLARHTIDGWIAAHMGMYGEAIE